MAKTVIDTGIDDQMHHLSGESRESISRSQKQGPRFRKAKFYQEEHDSNRRNQKWVKEAYHGPYKELIIPNLNGQFKLWKTQLRRRADMADRVIQLGNILGLHQEAIDPLNKNKTVYAGNAGMVFAITKFYHRTHPGWEQLIGTNEVAAIFSPDAYLVSEKGMELLAQHWFEDTGILKVATAIDGKLVTHRGMTYFQWLSIGSPEDAETAAERLNEKYKGVSEFGDCYLNNGVPNMAADPIWADLFYETYSSWVFAPEPCPFPQIHSAAGMHTTAGRMFLNDKSSFVQFLDRSDVTLARWGSSLKIKGQDFISAYTTETEQDTTLTKLKKTGLLEYNTELAENME